VLSEYETFGKIAAESQFCGTPVVTFDTRGLPEVVKPRLGGLVVAKRDVPALCEAIKFCMQDPPEVERMGREGTEWSRQHFSAQKIAKNCLDIYRENITEREGWTV
jgi:glycosyltransferase involved in cell wall biosynthesis